MKKLWFKFLDFFSLKKKIKKDGKIYTRVSIEEFKKKIAEDKLPLSMKIIFQKLTKKVTTALLLKKNLLLKIKDITLGTMKSMMS